MAMANPTNCLTCSEWARTDDPCVGLCRKLQHYTFKLEGDECGDYAPAGERREVGEPAELPEPKKYPDYGYTRSRILANQERIRRWKREGRPYLWMAQMCRIPYWNYQLIPKWLAREEMK